MISEQHIGICGNDCQKCNFFLNGWCKGCLVQNNDSVYAICPIYACAYLKNEITSCSLCSEKQCTLFIEVKKLKAVKNA